MSLTLSFFLTQTITETRAEPRVEPRVDKKKPNKVRPWEIGALPLLNYTSETGLGYGAYAAIFHRKELPKIGRPYEFSVGVQYYKTTGGFEFHRVNFDMPSLPKEIRLGFYGALERWTHAIYVGEGHHTFIDAGRPTSDYNYRLQSVWLVPQVRVPLFKYTSLFSRLTFRQASVQSKEETLLREEEPDGVNGGDLFQLEVGILLDLRDMEPCTTRGFFTELSLRGGSGRLLSTEDHWGVNITHRHWWTLGHPKWVLATRLAFDYQGGWVPFFNQHILGGFQRVEIGGNKTMRGFPKGRFRARGTLYGNVELRVDAVHFNLFDRQFDLSIVPFIDWGRFIKSLDSLEGELNRGEEGAFITQLGFGIGPRLILERIFVLRFEFAWGVEHFKSGPQGAIEHRLTKQFYAIADHPF